MTSHHDAGLCERLRVNTCRYADETEEAAAKRRIATDLAAADLLESQAKALSEAEAAYDGLMKAKETFRAEAHRNAARALAAEARLAQAMRVIEPFARYHAWEIRLSEHGFYVRCRYEDQPQFKHFEAARAFTNAAKTQESKDA